MVSPTTPQSAYQLLRDCTVRVELNGKPNGTGFFVAPGLILTCAHVVSKATDNKLVVTWKGQSLPAQIKKVSNEQYPDLALLTIELTTHPCVFLLDDAQPLDRLYTYGYPDQHPEGDPATLECEGTTNEQTPLLRLKNAQIRPGMSGAPVLNLRTQRVCGQMQYTRGRENDMGGRALPVSMILREFPELVDLQRLYHQHYDSWASSTKAITVFYAYDEEDIQLQKKLRTHLSLLRRQGWISEWDTQEISLGTVPEDVKSNYLNTAEIILLLVSADFIASDYCDSEAMGRIMERSAEGSAIVIPVLLRTCDWKDAPFGKLMAIPRPERFVDKWANKDEAFQKIAEELRATIKSLTSGTSK